MLKDVLLVIAVFSAFAVGHIALCGVDRFFGNSGKWIKRLIERKKERFVLKVHRKRKDKEPVSESVCGFFRDKIVQDRQSAIKKMEKRAEL